MNHPKHVIVIPARYKSSRLPGKPLIKLLGKTMIQRTYEQCLKAESSENIYIATDNEKIFEHCTSFGAQVIITSPKCKTGTDRVAEAANHIPNASHFINVQGDEPVFNPEDITKLITASQTQPHSIINGYCNITSTEDYHSRSIPKVIFRPDGRLLYMSRSPIPGHKDSNETPSAHRQVCAYSFPKKALTTYASSETKTPLETIEDIEILRFLELGFEVEMIELSTSSVAVDTPGDIPKAEQAIKKNNC